MKSDTNLIKCYYKIAKHFYSFIIKAHYAYVLYIITYYNLSDNCTNKLINV